jgi:imidazolonepropionase-like amidohydrolase
MRTQSTALALGVLLLACSAVCNAQDIAVRGEMVYPVTGAPLENGVVVVRGGKIAAIGPSGRVRIPPGIEVAEAAVVTPGLIDARSVVGLAGYLNQPHDQDQIERSEPIQPELRAIDAYNTREMLIDWLRSFGITTIHTGHAPGEVISGQTMIAKTAGDTLAEAAMVPLAMVAATLGEGAVVVEGSSRKTPGNRSKAVALLRAELVKARTYADKKTSQATDEDQDPPARDLRMDALSAVLEGDVPLLITAHRHHDIITALRIRDEFGFRLVLDGAAEAYLVLEELKSANVPVLVHAPMVRAFGERENVSFNTPASLATAGVPFAFQSGFEGYVPKTRVVLFEAAIAIQHGLPFDQALASLTIDAARILGIDERVGSLEVGKDGDLALYDGDPFEYTTHAVGTVIDGVRVSDRVR